MIANKVDQRLFAFLLFGVLAPTGCILWFMNAAAKSQGAAARQSVTEAWRGQLRSMRDRADSFWLDRASEVQAASEVKAASGGSAPAAFQKIVQQGLADSVVLPGYPMIARDAHAETPGRADWRSAAELERRGNLTEAAERYGRIAESEANPDAESQAAQAQIRCLARSGDKEGALRTIRRLFATSRTRSSVVPGTRSIAGDELLLGLRLLQRDDVRYIPAAELLSRYVNDYAGAAMPSAQRLFLMDELSAALPRAPAMPTRDAESLALRFLDTDIAGSVGKALGSTHLPGVWKLPSPDGRVVALYRTATVEKAMSVLFGAGNPSHSVKFDVFPPGAKGGPEAIAAGELLPGWQVSFSVVDSRLLDDAEHGGIASNLWIGYLAITFLAMTGVLVGHWLRREVNLARLKTDLVSAVSHELRTPLASMRVLIETLLDDEAPEREKVREYLRLMDGENVRLSRMIENFLAFSRIERNRQRFVFAPTPVADVIDKAINAMGERLQPPLCELERDLGAEGVRVSADEDALGTVMVNLLDNACKYTPVPRKISVATRRVGQKVILSVRDNGIGIASGDLRRIFRRFYQVDQRLARETGGCGLGLSIVEFVVRAHGGMVQVDSSPGKGSTFSVILPCCAAPAPTGQTAVLNEHSAR